VLPLLFCASSAYMLWSSLSYTGIGALVGVAVLLAGVPILWFMNRRGGYPDEGQRYDAQESVVRVGSYSGAGGEPKPGAGA
jgi:hypothetical protein